MWYVDAKIPLKCQNHKSQSVQQHDIVISAVDDRYLVFDGSVHECPSLRLRRRVNILMIKTIKLNRCIFGLSQFQDLGT